QLSPCALAVFGLLHDDQLRSLFDDLPKSVPEDRMVVGDQNSYGIAHSTPQKNRTQRTRRITKERKFFVSLCALRGQFSLLHYFSLSFSLIRIVTVAPCPSWE